MSNQRYFCEPEKTARWTEPRYGTQEIVDHLELYIHGWLTRGGTEGYSMACAMLDAALEIERLRSRLSRYEPKPLESEYGPALAD